MLETLVPIASSYASDIDFLFALITVIVGFWFVLTELVYFGLMFYFRRKEGVKAKYLDGEGHEKHWIHIPHWLIIVCDVVLIIGTIVVWVKVKQDLPPAERTIRIEAQQWAWTFTHPGPDGKLDTEDDIVKIDELHIEEGIVYHFKLSALDVIHSFSVPVFRLKQDAVPGRVITGWFEATKTGEYDIQCAEMCGIGHGIMSAKIYIGTKADHQFWLNNHDKKSFFPSLAANF